MHPPAGTPLILSILLLLTKPDGVAQGAPVPPPVEEKANEVSLVPDQPSVMLGEPVHLSFFVKNHSACDLQIIIGGDYRNRLGRPNTFTVTVRGEDGRTVPQPDAGLFGGGISGLKEIAAGGTYTFRLFLPHWATPEKPADYTVSAKRLLKLKVPNPEDLQNFSRGTTDLTREATTRLKITSTDSAKMGSVIDEFARRMFAEEGRDDGEPTESLLAVHDERVIPHFLKALRTRDYSLKLHALTGLAAYDSDLALEGLKDGLKTTGKDFERSSNETIGNQLANNIHQPRFMHATARRRGGGGSPRWASDLSDCAGGARRRV